MIAAIVSIPYICIQVMQWRNAVHCENRTGPMKTTQTPPSVSYTFIMRLGGETETT